MSSTPTLADRFGSTAAREFDNAKDVHKPDLLAWLDKLTDLDDATFRARAAGAIHGSALVNSFRGNWEHEHCKASAAYHESRRRHRAAGHTEDCHGDTLYDEAFRQVWREQGHDPSAYKRKPCDCGATPR